MATTTTPIRGYAKYRTAAETLWGPAGAYAVDAFARLNEEHFDNEIKPVPIVIGITAYGRCVGLTRSTTEAGKPRITIASNAFAPVAINPAGRKTTAPPPYGPQMVDDVMVHEMIHALLVQRGEDPSHNGQPFIDEIVRLSPAILGHEIEAVPQVQKRIDGKNIRWTPPGHLDRDSISRWPHSLRAPWAYNGAEPIPVDSY
jgi:hypothetical protein